MPRNQSKSEEPQQQEVQEVIIDNRLLNDKLNLIINQNVAILKLLNEEES